MRKVAHGSKTKTYSGQGLRAAQSTPRHVKSSAGKTKSVASSTASRLRPKGDRAGQYSDHGPWSPKANIVGTDC